MLEFLFLDLDDTILDFKKAEHIAIRKTLSEFGLEPTDEVCSRYVQINLMHWHMLERREITREQVLLGRFAMLFEELGMTVDAAACAASYERNLSMGHYFLPGAPEALEALSKKYRLFLASNGTARVQAGRIASANISRFFEKIFVSQDVGADKPSGEYFDRCFTQIPGFDRERAMIVGDSLSSDILGGNNAGIYTCWVNPGKQPRREGLRIDHEIEYLAQLPKLLETL